MNKIRSRRFTFFMVLAVLVAATCGGPVMAEEESPTADLTISLMSQYLWRGYELSRGDSLVVQPSMTIGYKGLSANIWENIDTDPQTPAIHNLNETDITLAYARDFGAFSGEAGYIWYVLRDAEYDSQEFYVTATMNTFLSPTLTIYREFYHAPSTYITLGISHSLPLPWDRLTLDLGLQGSYLWSNDEGVYADPDDPGDEYSNFHDGLLSASVTIPVNRYLSMTPEVNWSFPLCSDAANDMQALNADHGGKDNFFYGGISIDFAF